MSVYENGINYGLRHERDVLRTFLRKTKKAANKRKREKKESPQEIRYRNAQHTKSKGSGEKNSHTSALLLAIYSNDMVKRSRN